MKIANGLNRIGSDVVNSYLVVAPDGISVIDATRVLPGHGPARDGGVSTAVQLIRETAAESPKQEGRS